MVSADYQFLWRQQFFFKTFENWNFPLVDKDSGHPKQHLMYNNSHCLSRLCVLFVFVHDTEPCIKVISKVHNFCSVCFSTFGLFIAKGICIVYSVLLFSSQSSTQYAFFRIYNAIEIWMETHDCWTSSPLPTNYSTETKKHSITNATDHITGRGNPNRFAFSFSSPPIILFRG